MYASYKQVVEFGYFLVLVAWFLPNHIRFLLVAGMTSPLMLLVLAWREALCCASMMTCRP
jgi:hypothetical protein